MRCANVTTMQRIIAMHGVSARKERAFGRSTTGNLRRRPILGQMLSREVTDVLIVVVRYFGGTKLGVPGLIEAYKRSAALVLENAEIEQRTVDVQTTIRFSYLAMNDVMRIVKELQPQIIAQQFDNLCTMTLAIRQGFAAQLLDRLSKVEGLELETDDQ